MGYRRVTGAAGKGSDGHGERGRMRNWSLARRLFLLQVVVVGLVVAAGSGSAWYDAQARTEREALDKVTAVARTLATQPGVRQGVRYSDPTVRLQPLAERARLETGVAFVTIMSPNGVRYTHPDAGRIGEHFAGHTPPGAGSLTETFTGTLGPSVRSVVPVVADDGQLRGYVSVGIRTHVLNTELRGQLLALGLLAAAALVVGGTLTALVSARLRRYTHGLTPAELASRYEYHEATLHAVHEGLLLISPHGRVRLCNDAAAELLSCPVPIHGVLVGELGLPTNLVETLASARPVHDEVHVTDEHVLLVNVSPVRHADRDDGTVVTLRDHTELRSLSGELRSVRGFAEALRSQAHESANRLHTIVSLIELGRTAEAVEFATTELATAQQLTDRVVGAVSEPTLAALLLGKSADAAERGVDLVLDESIDIDDGIITSVGARDLVTILGNLIDNAVESVCEQPRPQVIVNAGTGPESSWIRVADNGPGVDAADLGRVFRRGWSTRASADRGIGLALVGQAVRRYGGRVDVHNDSGAVFTVHLPANAGWSAAECGHGRVESGAADAGQD